MKVGQRLLLVVYSLLVIAIVVAFSMVMCGVFEVSDVAALINVINNNILLTACVIIIALGLIIFSVAMMFLGTGKSLPSAMIKSTENGNINISIDTINTITSKVVKSVPKVRDTKVSTVNSENGITVNIKIALMSDAVIPEVTAEVQKTVKQHIECVVGLSVSNIPVLVDNSIVAQN